MRLLTTLFTVAVLLSGCAGQPSRAAASPANQASPTATPASQPTAATSPAASPAASPPASPAPVTGAFGVLVTPPAGGTYTVSLIGIDGRVAGSAQASGPAQVTCGNGAAAVVPLPVSTSNTRAYYMDAQGVVRFLTVQGVTGRATTVPIGGSRRSMFAVSPDDQRIAVVVSDYAANGASIRLYVEDLNGATNHVDIFSSTGAYGLWPIGWHGTTDLVVAKVPACAQGGGPFCCGPLELHVVDPATGNRRFTLGGSGCVIAGAPSLAGVACEETPGFTTLRAVNWTGGVMYAYTYAQGAAPAYLAPDGSSIAVVSNSTTKVYVGGSQTMQACEWMDSSHLLAGGDAQQQPRIWDFTNPNLIPVAAQGDCAGRIPGGL